MVSKQTNNQTNKQTNNLVLSLLSSRFCKAAANLRVFTIACFAICLSSFDVVRSNKAAATATQRKRVSDSYVLTEFYSVKELKHMAKQAIVETHRLAAALQKGELSKDKTRAFTNAVKAGLSYIMTCPSRSMEWKCMKRKAIADLVNTDSEVLKYSEYVRFILEATCSVIRYVIQNLFVYLSKAAM